MYGFNGEPHEDDDFKQDSNIFDPSYDPMEDFCTPNEVSSTMKMSYKPDDMGQVQFLRPCMEAKARGGLRDFLGALGISGEAAVARVNSILDENYPSLNHQTDILFEMMEEEFGALCIGSVTRLGDVTEEGGFVECNDTTTVRLKALQSLYELRMARLEIRKRLDDRFNKDMEGKV